MQEWRKGQWNGKEGKVNTRIHYWVGHCCHPLGFNSTRLVSNETETASQSTKERKWQEFTQSSHPCWLRWPCGHLFLPITSFLCMHRFQYRCPICQHQRCPGKGNKKLLKPAHDGHCSRSRIRGGTWWIWNVYKKCPSPSQIYVILLLKTLHWLPRLLLSEC
jgi:hypothetical protein